MTAPCYIPAHDWELVTSLPEAWRWQAGWRFAKRLGLHNPTPLSRPGEPIEIEAEFYASQIDDPEREIRVVQDDGDRLVEKPCQAHLCPQVSADTLRVQLFFLADLPAEAEVTCLVFYGNPAAELPVYDTDLQVSGDGWALTVDNRDYRVELAPSMGQLKSVYFKTRPPVSHEPSACLLGAGPPMDGGHGVEGTVHWGPDWSDEHAGRYRITNWEEAPNCEVLRGPVCLRLKRWGHPILALGPDVGRSGNVVTTVTYTFYAGCPWFVMESKMEVLEDVRFRDCRNDEWVGMIPALPESAWMTRDGTIGLGPRSWRGEDPAWMTYFNRTRSDGFATIHLDYECTHPNGREPELVALTASSMRLRTRGGWVRYPIRNALMRAGDYVFERNAYLLYRYGGVRDQGFGMLRDYQTRLTQPVVQAARLPAPKPLTLDNVMDALRDCYDHETYIQGDLFGQRLVSVIDLGLVRDIALQGDEVRIAAVMPYRGRETWFDWFADNMEARIRERLAGVGGVRVELVREPAWSPSAMNHRARRLLGIQPDS